MSYVKISAKDLYLHDTVSSIKKKTWQMYEQYICNLKVENDKAVRERNWAAAGWLRLKHKSDVTFIFFVLVRPKPILFETTQKPNIIH